MKYLHCVGIFLAGFWGIDIRKETYKTLKEKIDYRNEMLNILLYGESIK